MILPPTDTYDGTDILYRSEWASTKALGIRGQGYQWPREVDTFTYFVQYEPWYTEMFGKTSIWAETSRRTGETGHAEPENGVIYIHRLHRDPWMILHEMSHCIAPSGDGHGPVFAGILLILWNRVLPGAHTKLKNVDPAETLRNEFDKRGVRYLIEAGYDSELYPPACVPKGNNS